jgi:interferon gamma-inducible protein 30
MHALYGESNSKPCHKLVRLLAQGLECQHGPAECRLNRVIACAIDQASVQEAWFPFLQCLEAKFGPGMEDTVEECAEAADLDFVDIEECASGTFLIL